MVPPAKKRERIPNSERTAETRGALLAAAEKLFTARGYAVVGTEEIVREAGVTRGALYHHFKDKRELFAAVFELMEQSIVAEVAKRVAASGSTDPWELAIGGALAFLDTCLDPAVQRIAIVEAQSVLGVRESRDVADRYGGALMRATIERLIETGAIDLQPVDPLARVLTGALIEGGVAIALAEDKVQARAEVGEAIQRLFRGLRTE